MRNLLDKLDVFAGFAGGSFPRRICWCTVAMSFLGLVPKFSAREMIRVGLVIDASKDRSAA